MDIIIEKAIKKFNDTSLFDVDLSDEYDHKLAQFVYDKICKVMERLTLKELLSRNPIDIEDYTCYNCCSWQVCPYSFDYYNTDGDCLASK